jgi:hypothetical protein
MLILHLFSRFLLMGTITGLDSSHQFGGEPSRDREGAGITDLAVTFPLLQPAR